MKRIAKLAKWAVSPEGRRDLGALAGIAVSIYTALHKAGVTP